MPLIISSSCGGTLEGDLKKRLAFGKEKAATDGLPSLSNYDSTLTY